MSESAVELEQRAERAVRRGELFAALELFEQVLAMEPDDERLQKRMESVRALLQPTETHDSRPPEVEEEELDAAPVPLTAARPSGRRHRRHPPPRLRASAGVFDET